MRSLFPGPLFALALIAGAAVDQAAHMPDAVSVGPGVTPPKLIRKVEPEYSAEARRAGVQGTVVLEIMVDEQGKPVRLWVLSPLGFGLDERAQAAVEQWRFTPGTRDGKPVKVLATVEVNFRFLHAWFDSKAERRRTRFNVAWTALQRRGSGNPENAVKTIRELAEKKYPAAMYVVGKWYASGDFVERDLDQARELFTRAADKNYGPAIYELGMIYYLGKHVRTDQERGLQLLRDAAILGSVEAQYFLGGRYQAGEGVARDLERARRYFRLCAAAGETACQVRLARMLLETPGGADRDRIQAIAWLELAADKGQPEARRQVGAELLKLTPEQVAWVQRLKAQLARGPQPE